MKLYIAASAVPVAEYYGFYVPRMVPFFKATGKNEIEVLVNSARTVQCWSWGSYNGVGWAEIHTYAPFVDFVVGTNKYFATMQFRALNLVVCKLGVAAGTTGTGDVVIIPATQLAPTLPTTVNNPLPLSASTAPYSSARDSLLSACNSGGNA